VRLFNGHQLASISTDFNTVGLNPDSVVGKLGVVESAIIGTSNQKVFVGVVIRSLEASLLYDLTVVLEGPAGVPFTEDLGWYQMSGGN
jgi:hypothetical protein